MVSDDQPQRSWKYLGGCLAALLGFVSLSASAVAGETQPPKELFELLEYRFHLMKDVAAFKVRNNIEVENRQREAAVLRQVATHARVYGLEPSSVSTVFELQIALAKKVQQSWIETWQNDPADELPPQSARDIAETRAELNTLGERIVRQLYLALPALHDGRKFEASLALLERTIKNPFITRAQKRELFHALVRINAQQGVTENRIGEILDRGVLRVGTTGDYKPFSFYQLETAEYTGVDIELAADLAQSLGVELRIVPTSWPTLMDDLSGNRFDIGMSGISRTLQRQRWAFFSDAYFEGGKTPISHCENTVGLNSLAAIDRRGVRVIVNPGGTNEKYVREYIKKAQLIVHADNTSVFQELITKRADVMITDAIEVRVQTALHSELCATMPGELLTHVEKAFLLPQDIYLKEYVDAWLREVKRAGRLEHIFARYIN